MNICENPPAINHHRISNSTRSKKSSNHQNIIQWSSHNKHDSFWSWPVTHNKCWLHVTSTQVSIMYTSLWLLSQEDIIIHKFSVCQSRMNSTTRHVWQQQTQQSVMLIKWYIETNITYTVFTSNITQYRHVPAEQPAMLRKQRTCSGMVQQINTNKYAKTVVVTSWNTGTWNFLELLPRHLTWLPKQLHLRVSSQNMSIS